MWLVVLLCVVLSASLMVGWSEPALAASKTPIKIGFSLPATGFMSQTGSVATKAAKAWAVQVNKAGGIVGHPVEAVFYDSETDPNKAILTAKQMVNSEKVVLLLGGGSTGLSLAIGPIAAQSKVPFIANSGSSLFESQMAKAGPETFAWNFRMSNCTSEEQTAWMLMLFSKMNVKKVAVIYPEDAYGQSGIAGIKDAIQKYPGVWRKRGDGAKLPVGRGNVRPLIASLKYHRDVQGILVRGATMASPLAIAAIRDVGIKLPIAVDSVQTAPQFMAVEKVKRAITREPGVLTYADMSFWKQLPDSNPAKPFYRSSPTSGKRSSTSTLTTKCTPKITGSWSWHRMSLPDYSRTSPTFWMETWRPSEKQSGTTRKTPRTFNWADYHRWSERTTPDLHGVRHSVWASTRTTESYTTYPSMLRLRRSAND